MRVKKIVLDNGIKVVAEPMPHYRSLSIGIWVKSGSRFESEQNNGISHLIEHMLFKGTETYDARTIASLFDRIGGNVNAFTTKEYTCYYAKVLAEHADTALAVLSDMYYRSRLDEHELSKEKNVIYEEIAMYEDTPDDLVHDLISIAAYGDHSLAYPILGTEQNLKALTSADLRQYMNQFYHGDNTVISIAGNVDDRILERVDHYFGKEGNRGKQAELTFPQFRSGYVFRKKDTEQNHICLALPGVSLQDERLYTMAVLNNVIGGGMSSRLFQEIREKRGLAYSIFSYHAAHEDSGQFTIYVGAAPKYTSELLSVLNETIGEWLATGIQEEELMLGKEQLRGGFLMSLESTSSRMNRLGKNELMRGRHDSVEETLKKIENVQAEDVNNLAREMFQHPFALAAVGETDSAIQSYRRDQLAISSPHQKT
jgi:predicted Zn-dependent peptidase